MSNELVDQIKLFEKEVDEAQKEFRRKAEDLFKNTFKKFFQLFPEVKAITWAQYTPYFNDGDECIFSVNEVYYVIDDIDPAVLEEANYWELEEYAESSWGLKRDGKNPLLGVAADAIDTMLNNMEDFLKASLGDHVQVTVTPDEVKVTEFEHD